MKTQHLLLTVLLLLTGCMSSEGYKSNTYKLNNDKTNTFDTVVVSEVVSIYDGDTFRVNIENFPAIIGENMPIRVLGIDTPEIRGKCQFEKDRAKDARLFTVDKLTQARRIELVNIQRGKYFRLLAEVVVDGESLGDSLIKQGFAVQYDGGKKKDWCKNLDL